MPTATLSCIRTAREGLKPLLADRATYCREGATAAHEALTSAAAVITEQNDALKAAEAFIAGFEGDEMQEGVDALLKRVRDAIEGVR